MSIAYNRLIDLTDLKEEAIVNKANGTRKTFERGDEVFSVQYGPGTVVRKATPTESSSRRAYFVDFSTEDFSILADNLISLADARYLGYKERYVGEPLPKKKTRLPSEADEKELVYDIVQDLEVYGMRSSFVRESTKFRLEEYKLGQRVLDVTYGPAVVSGEKTITTVDVKITVVTTAKKVVATYLLPYEKALEFGYTPRYEPKSRQARPPLPAVRIIPQPPPRRITPEPVAQAPPLPARPIRRMIARITAQ